MIPYLYEKGSKEFNGSCICRLSGATVCQITEERNGEYTLDMEYDPDDMFAGNLKPHAIIYAQTERGDLQPFDIVSVTRTYGESIKVFAQHISYRLAGIPIRTLIGSTKMSTTTASGAMSDLLSWAPSNIDVTDWTLSSNVESPTATWSPEEPASAKAMIQGDNKSILTTYGGELLWDGFTCQLMTSRGKDNGVVIRYGKNIVGIDNDSTSEGAINATYAYWERGDDEVYQPSASGKLTESNIPYDYAQVINLRSEFDDRPSYSDLVNRATALTSGKDVDQISITIDLATGYDDGLADIGDLDSVHLCDTVHVIFEPYDIDISTKVVKTVYDVLMDRLDSVEIGTIRNTIADTIAGSGTTVNYNTSGGGDYEARVSALEESVGDLEETVGGLSLTNIGTTKLGSVGTTQSTITLPSTTGAFIIVTTHASTTGNNAIWIVRGTSGVFKIGGGSNITITKSNATLTVKSTSGNSDLYAIKLN